MTTLLAGVVVGAFLAGAFSAVVALALFGLLVNWFLPYLVQAAKAVRGSGPSVTPDSKGCAETSGAQVRSSIEPPSPLAVEHVERHGDWRVRYTAPADAQTRTDPWTGHVVPHVEVQDVPQVSSVVWAMPPGDRLH